MNCPIHNYHKQVTNVCSACFCHPAVENFDVSPYLSLLAPFIPLWKVFHHPFPRRGMGMVGVDGEIGERVGG